MTKNEVKILLAQSGVSQGDIKCLEDNNGIELLAELMSRKNGGKVFELTDEELEKVSGGFDILEIIDGLLKSLRTMPSA